MVNSIARVAVCLARIERCVLLSETVAGVFGSTAHPESECVVELLGGEAASALCALEKARKELERLRRRTLARRRAGKPNLGRR
jgi:hypothetical protein